MLSVTRCLERTGRDIKREGETNVIGTDNRLKLIEYPAVKQDVNCRFACNISTRHRTKIRLTIEDKAQTPHLQSSVGPPPSSTPSGNYTTMDDYFDFDRAGEYYLSLPSRLTTNLVNDPLLRTMPARRCSLTGLKKGSWTSSRPTTFRVFHLQMTRARTYGSIVRSIWMALSLCCFYQL